jgi:glucose/arabinose dehydrogenase
MRPSSKRRQFLAAVGAASSLVTAGCFGAENPDGTDSSTDSFEPVDSPYDLSVDHDIETWDRYDPDWQPPDSSPLDASLETETLVENLEIPWDVSFAASGELFFSERVGGISRYDAGDVETVTESADVIDHASSVSPDEKEADWWGGGSEGGQLGIALHPGYPDPPVLYGYYTYRAGPEAYRNRLVYYDIENDAEETVIVDDVPGHRIIHNGGRLGFGPRNYLWVTTGDANREEAAGDPNSLAGTVLRLNPDGTVPEDNPGEGDPRVYSYGHRNPQSISWLPDGTPITSEHGPSSRDEVNVVEGGGNYGWPAVRSAPDDDGAFESYDARDDVTPPLVQTGGGTTWAPSGGVFYTGNDVPALRNRFLVGGLVSQRLNVVSIYERRAPNIGGKRHDSEWLYPAYDAVTHSLFEDELGRIRHVEQGPDGALYAITSNRDGRSAHPEEDTFPRQGDDRLVRIVQS